MIASTGQGSLALKNNSLSLPIHRLATQLEQGWDERIQWTDAEGVKHFDTVYQPSILAQLQVEIYEPRAMTSSENKNANKAGSRAPGNTEALHLREECIEALSETRKALKACSGLDTPSLGAQVAYIEGRISATAPDYQTEQFLRDIKKDLGSKVAHARIILGYDVPQKALPDMPCERCKGVLVVAEDASSDVRCVGRAPAPSCGKVYRRHDWVPMLQKIQARVSTVAACTYTGRSLPTLYRWALEGRVHRYGSPHRGRSTWDLSELPEAVPGQPLPPPPPLPTARTHADT